VKGRINDPNKGIPTFYEDPEMQSLIEPYIRYLVRSTRYYGNIIYEVANEYSGPAEWHQWVAEKIKEQIQEDRKASGMPAERGKHRLVSANVHPHLIRQVYYDKSVDMISLHSGAWCRPVAGKDGTSVISDMSITKKIAAVLQLFPGKPVILSTDGFYEKSWLVESPLQDVESRPLRPFALPDRMYTWANEIVQRGGHFEFVDYKVQMSTSRSAIRPNSWNINFPVLQKLSEVNLVAATSSSPGPAAIPSVSRSSSLKAQRILEDPLTSKSTVGQRQGGEFTSEGFKVTSALNNFLLYQPILSRTEPPWRQIRIEFEAKGFIPNEPTDSKLVFFRMFDAPPDKQEGNLSTLATHHLYEIRKYGLEGGQIGKSTNGLGLRLGGRGIRNFIELGTWV
ncbi:MAG: hypothetical protein L0Y56_17745, partial [Nitrospira sp.]|nr:hypothetical protein [Nitrospira sp.]